jgi:xanthine dehydrogenase accessory factor
MRDILAELTEWNDRGERIALATVVQTWGSSPRRVGAKMGITSSGKIAGSVSGGCVEGAVAEIGFDVLKTGKPQLLHFGVGDETAWEVGLACGGQIDVFVQPLGQAIFNRWRDTLLAERAHTIVTIVRGSEDRVGRQSLIDDNQDSQLIFGNEIGPQIDEKVRLARKEDRSGLFTVEEKGEQETEIFVEVVSPAPVLIMVGGVHIAIALTSLAKTLGFQTVLVDPRKSFSSRERFPHVDRLVQAWPEEAFSQIELHHKTAVAMLTHDPKIDDPALQVALRSPAFYVGALGSRQTQARRRKRLLESGLSESQLDRLHGPIGVDIGAETPEEIALAVLAEIVAARHKPVIEV